MSGMMPTTVRGLAADGQLPADDAWIAAVAALPQALANHHDRFGAGFAIGGNEVAAQAR